MQAVKDVQAGTRILYVICAEGKANKNITIANLVSYCTHTHRHTLCQPALYKSTAFQHAQLAK